MTNRAARRMALLAAPMLAVTLAACSPAADAPAAAPIETPAAATPSPTETSPPGSEPSADAAEIIEQGGRIAPYPGPAQPDTHPKCETIAWTETSREDPSDEWQTEMFGEPVDTGAESMATGTAELDDSGVPITYTVASGDVINAIGARFCIDTVNLAMFNGLWGGDGTIHPGDRLLLQPDPTKPAVVPGQ
ncbi:LysM peptidoglycan-binding domain-containing protein [Microbacterium sp. LRZ72]|uniref:LysM domain-containing protein n=1 Tax=Microbacterium sp. LRZ72 TaxID=2942481 RepID=UPI0029BAC363|nr:LysM domain-containing protein [Microbacterium sp. LRZ72]MDX2378086.1 LysM peptidoglycan-binding domain-containing protein [Microbacterium sp. LRZ72]